MRNTRAPILCAFILASAAFAQEYNLSKDGIGPISLKLQAEGRGKKTKVTAICRNESTQPIRRAIFCVRGPYTKSGCDWLFPTASRLPPGEDVFWSPTGFALNSSVEYKVSLVEIEKEPNPRLAPIRKLCIDQIAGNNGPLVQDQLIALLTNTGRFEVVEDKSKADAIVRGRSETRTKETITKKEGQEAGSASVGGVSVFVASKGKRSERTEEKSEVILAETTLLRLSSSSGDLLWAWDDTRPCETTKAQCAIADLVDAAKK
jgi:hypothetical protein